ncbi:hypothetical protein AVEN_182322-1 [Araneus ventricosus]|uniref:Uncharacterized protein n=1 Tax=Araneus ventricosus TaxID=182803 RepID=A0A4Y2IDG1_ARAVE|nr:hypothetical protein AVEN_182322-1 [Araneus ventricosus]
MAEKAWKLQEVTPCTLASGSTSNDQPPRLNGNSGSRIIALIKSGSCDDPHVLPVCHSSSEMGPKNHTTIIIHTGRRIPAYLSVHHTDSYRTLFRQLERNATHQKCL